MRLLQVLDADGHVRLGLLDGERASILERTYEDITTSLDLLRAIDGGGLDADAWRRGAPFREVAWAALQDGAAEDSLTVPVTPPEVWGAGVTYRRSADFREEGTGIYDRVYEADRPELFFKATASRCVGPGGAIGRRRDSSFTATEPEMAIVIGATGDVLGYTVANDVSAWDIERDNPLYLPQSKVYRGCFSFGPVIVTGDEIADPYALELHCRVERGGDVVFSGSASTAQLKRRFPELVGWLRRSDDIPAGSVLSTGTGIIQPMDVGLEVGDVVVLSCPEIGELRNPVVEV
jgi:2-dehydro-3-deoxy-D-arabinonate dehydratase